MADEDELIAAVESLVVAAVRHRIAAAATAGLVARDLIALDALLRDPGLSPDILSRLLMITPHGTAGTLRRLQETGLVRRTTTGADHRDVQIWLTPAGREAARCAPIGLGEVIRARVGDDSCDIGARATQWIRAVADHVDHDTAALVENVARVSRPVRVMPTRVWWG